MTWTRNKPDRAATWLYRDQPTRNPELLTVVKGKRGFLVDDKQLGELQPVEHYLGEWSSEPIEQPKEA